MAAYLSHFIGDQHLVMSAERALFWEDEKTLIVADLHVGKTGHFRREGIAVPQQVYKDDLHRLLSQILFFKAERLIIVGDLTHSAANKETDLFRRWRKDFPSLDVHLVKGNHDTMTDAWYEEADITVSHVSLQIRNFVFAHDFFSRPVKKSKGDYVFSGHIHPGVTLSGRGRQSLHFPCFYFTADYCVLPAFSRFTGTFKVRPAGNEEAFAVVSHEVVPVKKRK